MFIVVPSLPNILANHFVHMKWPYGIVSSNIWLFESCHIQYHNQNTFMCYMYTDELYF